MRLPRSLLIVGLILGLAAPARANEALRPALAVMGKQIAQLLQGRGEDSIAVGAFTGASRLSASSGPGITKVLVEELEKLGVHVKSRANLEVKGDYLDVLDRASQLLALRIKAQVLDRDGEAVVVLDKKIEDPDVLAQVLGVNRPDLGGGVSPKRASEEVKKRIDNPSVDLAGTKIRTGPTSPYAIEVLIKSAGRYEPRRPTGEDGRAFVAIQKGEVFAINLINDSDHDAAVELTLDGLSMFAFSSVKGYRHVVVPKKGNAAIKGWHRTNETSDEFVVTEYAGSAAAELLASPDGIGTITAAFAAAWDPKEGPPADEAAKFRDPFGPAIGRGGSVQTPYAEVVRERGRVRDVINVRYKKPER
jgi:hypothetical protein